MTYEYLKHIKLTNQTLKLLSADNFAFMLSFFHLIFIQKRNFTLVHSEIVQLLDDYLFEINSIYERAYPKTAKEYLDDFVNDKNGYLRKYHGDSDEPLYELTPPTSKALEFIESLKKNEFIASQSKFNIVFELLQELEFETNMDTKQRIEKLLEQKREIDQQIEDIKNKKDLRFDSARIKEHYMLLDEIVRKLKYDFSQMEYNFRDLNKLAMEQITLRDTLKSGVLESVFEVENEIRQSDQGKSFFAFWQLLTDGDKNKKLEEMLENLYKIKTIKAFDSDEKLKNMKYDLLKSADKIYRVSAKLIEQLRRFIDDRIWIENKRVLDLCKNIEKTALDLKQNEPKQRNFFHIKGSNVKIDSIGSKKLFTPKKRELFKNEELEEVIDVNMDSFYNLFYVDEDELKQNIATLLLHKKQVTLLEVLQKYPIKKGISEVVAYVSIAKNSDNTMIDEMQAQIIEIRDFDNKTKKINLANIIFLK
ncbi:MAG: DUF3375 domain-containing protein [Sulfurimonas sp.]|nr:DUF3375 domain-containing protein [Sulfurimonas sp.]